MNKNWIKLNRKFQSWEWKKKPKMVALFIHLLLEANWKPGRFEGRLIERGQFATSVRSISVKTGLTEKEVRGGMAKLETSKEIKIDARRGQSFSVITICNYDRYQSSDVCEGEQKGDFRAISGRTEGDFRATIEKGNNDKNDKKERRVDAPSLDQEVDAFNHPAMNKIMLAYDDFIGQPVGNVRSLATRCLAGALDRQSPDDWYKTMERYVRERRGKEFRWDAFAQNWRRFKPKPKWSPKGRTQ